MLTFSVCLMVSSPYVLPSLRNMTVLNPLKESFINVRYPYYTMIGGLTEEQAAPCLCNNIPKTG